ARRTNRPVEFFLAEPAGAPDETQASLIELEALVADGRNQEAIALGMSLLDRGTSGFRLGRIRYLLAQAYLATAQPERAAPFLTCGASLACTAGSARRTERWARSRSRPGTRCDRSRSWRCCETGWRSLARRTTWPWSSWRAGT